VGDAHDAQRSRDLLPGRLAWQALAVPALHQLSERTCHRVGHVQALGEEARAFAQVRRRQTGPLLACGQHLGEQTGAFRQRPVVRQPTKEIPDVL
jgi:hypothetical protein